MSCQSFSSILNWDPQDHDVVTPDKNQGSQNHFHFSCELLRVEKIYDLIRNTSISPFLDLLMLKTQVRLFCLS